MLSNKKIICPNNLIEVAKKTGTVDAAIVNAGEIFPMESVHKAVQHNLINPIFIGDNNEIKKYADKLKWNISKYKIIDEKNENNTAPIAAKLASEDKVKIIVKGHIHTDVLMKEVLKRKIKEFFLNFDEIIFACDYDYTGWRGFEFKMFYFFELGKEWIDFFNSYNIKISIIKTCSYDKNSLIKSFKERKNIYLKSKF